MQLHGILTPLLCCCLSLAVRSCVLKGSPFSGDYGTNVLSDKVTRSCVQTLYTTPEDSASRRRRALAADAGGGYAAIPRPLRRTLTLDARSQV